MQVLFDKNIPKSIVEAIQLVQKLDTAKQFDVALWTRETESNNEKPVIFIVDTSAKGLEITTHKHFEEGYRIFAFKLKPNVKLDFYQFALTLLKLWPRALEAAKEHQKPFVFTYRYGGSKLRKILK